MDYQPVVDGIGTAACVVSVELMPNGDYGNIRIVTGNQPYINSIEHPFENVTMLTRTFIPNSEYTCYLNRDLNFEDSCYQAAVRKKCLHAYVHPARFDVWFDMTFLPLAHHDDNTYYCLYIMEVNYKPDAKRMSTISAGLASAVLQTCIKLRSAEDFKVTMSSICTDIRQICSSKYCCMLLMDHDKRSCSVLCESIGEGSDLLPMETYLDDNFYDIADSWQDTIAGSNCLIIKNHHDMEAVRERNPRWYRSIQEAGVESIVLFPLEFKNELLGYIWAINFAADAAESIKETLELTAFILASEIYGYQLMDRLHVLSSKDMLTGVMNRNEMNNFVDSLVKSRAEKSVGVLFADLNGLKRVNDSDGHIAGDTLLKNAAAALREVFATHEVFRAGGDEFVVILTDVTEHELAQKEQQLRDAAAHYEELAFAIGTAHESSIRDVRKALHIADERMYADKRHYYELHPEKKRIVALP